MIFNRKFFAALFAISAVDAHGAIKPRGSVSDFTLYAYGTNITGQSIFYADSLAYIGNGIPSGASIASNITFSTIDPTSNTGAWSVASNGSVFTGTPSLYIVPTNGSFEQVGFYNSSNGTSSLPTGGVTTGFMLFGSSLSYVESDGTMEQQFWAQATDSDGIWKLMWNAGGEGGLTSDGFAITPVNIKSTAPLVINNNPSN